MFIFRLIHTGILPARKVFSVRDQFVIQSVEPYSKGVRSQHSHTLANTPQGVNIFLFIIFRLGQAFAMPNQISLINEKIE
jgi:hypothetical protein